MLEQYKQAADESSLQAQELMEKLQHAGSAQQDHAQQIACRQREIDELRTQLQADKSAHQDRLEQLQSQLQAVERAKQGQVEQLQQQSGKLQGQLQSAQAEASELSSRVEFLQSQLRSGQQPAGAGQVQQGTDEASVRLSQQDASSQRPSLDDPNVPAADPSLTDPSPILAPQSRSRPSTADQIVPQHLLSAHMRTMTGDSNFTNVSEWESAQLEKLQGQLQEMAADKAQLMSQHQADISRIELLVSQRDQLQQCLQVRLVAAQASGSYPGRVGVCPSQ